MRTTTIITLLFFCSIGYAQQTHSSLVAINQPTVCTITQIETPLFKDELKVYPNPSNNTLTIESKLGIDKLLILDINGKIIYTEKYKTGLKQTHVNLKNYARGTYYCISSHGNHTTKTKLVLQ